MIAQRVVIVGDGPAGLSAALLLAKTGFDVTVVGQNGSAVHKAMLHNYLGHDAEPGPELLARSRAQAESFGAKLVQAKVERIDLATPFHVITADQDYEGDHLVLATGFSQELTKDLPLERSEDGIRVDHNGRTSREGVYAAGAAARGVKSQVATSVGDGAAVAIDLLSQARGKPSHDYDVLKAAPQKAIH